MNRIGRAARAIGTFLGAGPDLPLGRDVSARFLAQLVGVMVFLAALVLAAALLVSATATHWRAGLDGTLTVQILPETPGKKGKGPAEPTAMALDILRATEGIARAERVPESTARALIEPWLGAGLTHDDLPLPVLIDVVLTPGASIDVEALGDALRAVAPGAMIDDHRDWRARIGSLASALDAVAAIFLALIGAATAAAVMFAVRAGIAIHGDAIELLHLIGARDVYVARLFQAHTAWMSFKGGLVGLVLALGTLGLGFLGAAIAGYASQAAALPGLGAWLLLATLPVAAGLIALVTARIAVLRALNQMV